MTANDYWGVFVVTANVIVLAYFLVVNFTYLALFITAFFSISDYARRKRVMDMDDLFHSTLAPEVSVIIPAFNEQSSIVEVVRAALMLEYPAHEVIAVSDGSTDRTLEFLQEAYDLVRITRVVEESLPTAPINGVYISREHQNLLVIDKAHSGKSDSLNAGINIARGEVICNIDADSLIEPDALLKIIRPFIEEPDVTVAAGGAIRVLNGCVVRRGRVVRVALPRSWLANLQIIEYVRAFLGARLGWAAMNALLIVPGAFGAFTKSILIETGGYRPDKIGEDMDLILEIHRFLIKSGRRYKIRFIPDTMCWTEVPQGYSQIARQRDRWQRGLIETMRSHEDMLFVPRYGVVGLLSFPFYFFFEMLGPVVELLGYAVVVIAQIFGFLSVSFLVLFLLLAVLYGFMISILGILLQSVALDRSPSPRSLAKMAFFALLDNLGYRQLNTWWRTKAYVTYHIRKDNWGRAGSRSGPARTGAAEREYDYSAGTLPSKLP